jgi:hypothetical protein
VELGTSGQNRSGSERRGSLGSRRALAGARYEKARINDAKREVFGSAAAGPSAGGEKPSLYSDENEMEDFRRSGSLMAPFMRVSGKMTNDKLREVKREVASELRGPRHAWAVTMQPVKAVMDRPRLLSDRSRLHSDRRKIENDDVVPETFTLPLEAARLKVRDIIDGISQRGYQEVVERWRQLPNGLIEFTVRHLPIAD